MWKNKKIIRFLSLIFSLLIVLTTITPAYGEWTGIIPDWWIFRFTDIDAKEYTLRSGGPYNLHDYSYKGGSSAVRLRIENNSKFLGIGDINDIESYKLTIRKADSYRPATEGMYNPTYRIDPGKLILDGKTYDYFLPVSHPYRWKYDNDTKVDEIPVWFMLSIHKDSSNWTDPDTVKDLWQPFVDAYSALMDLAGEVELQGEAKKAGDFHPYHKGYLVNAANEWSYILQNSSAHLDPRLDENRQGTKNPKRFCSYLRRAQIQAAIETMYTHIDYVHSHRVNEPEILAFNVNGYHGVIDKDNSKVILRVPEGISLDLNKVEITTPDWTIARHKSGKLEIGSTAIYRVQALDALHENYGVDPYENVKSEWTVEVVEGEPTAIINSVRYLSPDGNKIEGNIAEGIITLDIPFGVDLNSLPLEIYHSGEELKYTNSNGEDVIFKNKHDLDVRSPLTLKLKLGAQEKSYILNVKSTKSTGNKIQSFKIGEYIGAINNNTIELTVPYGTDKAKLKPVIEIDYRSTIFPKSNVIQDFSNIVEYRVTSESGETRTYKVEVIYDDPATGNSILDFKVGNISGNIVGEDITLTLPSNVNLSNIKPTIEISPHASITPASGEFVDFSKGKVPYVVIAQNGNTKTYFVDIKSEGEVTGPTEEYLHKLKTIRGNIVQRYRKDASDDWDWMNLGFYEGVDNGIENGIRKDSGDLPERFDLYKEIRDLKTIKLTDMARGVMMLTSMGIDASNLDQYGINGESFKTGNSVEVSDLTERIYNFSGNTTVNDFIFGLIALDMGNYSIPNNAKYTRNDLLDIILDHKYGTDNFGVDMVAMLMQSLYPYRDDPVYGQRVRDKLDEGLDIILGHKTAPKVEPMGEDFMFNAWGATNSESADQVIMAICSMGIDPYSDIRFSKGPENNLIYNVINRFVTNDMSGFGHDSNSYNHMATYQGMYMLQWYVNFTENGGAPYSLYYDGVPFDFSRNFNSKSEITRFELLGKEGDIDHVNGTITIKLPMETTNEQIKAIPIIEISENATLSPAIGISQDFTKEITYTVTAEDGSTTKSYNVLIDRREDVISGEKDLRSFAIEGFPNAKVTINKQNREISVILPSDTATSKLKNLTVSIGHSGESISPDPNEPQDFTKDVVYTIMGKDGSTARYTVKVSIETADKYEFTKFVLRGIAGEIDTVRNKININLPFGAYVENIKPNEAKYSPVESTTSIVPAPTISRSFEDENIYKIVPYPADNTVEYNVNIEYIEAGGNSNISSFAIGGYSGVVGKNSITMTIPTGKTEKQFKEELKDMVPKIDWTGATLDPMPNGENNSLDDYLKDYVLSDEDGNVNTYIVKFTGGSGASDPGIIEQDEIEITSFTVNGIKGTIDNGNGKIFLEIPFETENYRVFPIITVSKDASLFPDLSQSIDLRENNVYTLRKGDTRKQYVLIVRRAEPKPATLLWKYMEEDLNIPYYQRID